MEPEEIWQLFVDTGAPEFYMLYNEARRTEDTHVSHDSRIGIKSHGI